MKIINRSVVVAFILGGIIFSSITGVIAYQFSAKDISYTPSNSNWKVNNVSDAIDELELYKQKSSSTLLWTNTNPTIFGPQTISLNITDYDYIIIDG